MTHAHSKNPTAPSVGAPPEKQAQSERCVWRLVRRLAIDWRAIAKETGCTRGTLARSPVFGWGVRGNGPADFCCITPPAVEAHEELRIEEGMWAVYAPNDKAQPRST